MDPNEGRRYIEPMKDEVVKGWDHDYNIFEDYIHPNSDGELGWHSASSASYDYDDALEKWQSQLHEVLIQKCGQVTQSMR